MFTDLEARLGHHFHRCEYLQTALTHRSFYFENRRESAGHFERLEFLGDSVLDLLLSEELMARFPEVDEGTLSKWRASLVNEASLSEIALEMELPRHLYVGKSELGSRTRPRLLASVFEAILAALYLDGGLETARAVVLREFAGRIDGLTGDNQYALDYKTRLQEIAQKRWHEVPEYRLLDAEGPQHARIFKFEVRVHGQAVGKGEGASRKAAEQAAAQVALKHFESTLLKSVGKNLDKDLGKDSEAK